MSRRTSGGSGIAVMPRGAGPVRLLRVTFPLLPGAPALPGLHAGRLPALRALASAKLGEREVLPLLRPSRKDEKERSGEPMLN